MKHIFILSVILISLSLSACSRRHPQTGPNSINADNAENNAVKEEATEKRVEAEDPLSKIEGLDELSATINDNFKNLFLETKSEQQEVRSNATEKLGVLIHNIQNVETRLWTVMRESEDDEQVKKAQILSDKISSSKVETFSLCLAGRKDAYYGVRAHAIHILGTHFVVQAKKYTKEFIEESLKDENETVVAATVHLLGKIALEDQSAIARYTELIKNHTGQSQEAVQEIAYYEGQRQESRDEIEIIVTEITKFIRDFEGDKSDRYKDVRMATVLCLGDLGKDAESALWVLKNANYDELEYQSVHDEIEVAMKKIKDALEEK